MIIYIGKRKNMIPFVFIFNKSAIFVGCEGMVQQRRLLSRGFGALSLKGRGNLKVILSPSSFFLTGKFLNQAFKWWVKTLFFGTKSRLFGFLVEKQSFLFKVHDSMIRYVHLTLIELSMNTSWSSCILKIRHFISTLNWWSFLKKIYITNQ